MHSSTTDRTSLLAKVNSYSLIFAFLAVLFLSITRFASLYFFGDPVDIQNNLSSLDELLIIGLRFDFRIVGIVLVLFVYLPFFLLFWRKNNAAYLTWVKTILSICLAIIVLLAFIDIGYFIFFGTPIDILIFGLLEDDTSAVIKSGIADPRLLTNGILAIISTIVTVVAFQKLSKILIRKLPLMFIPKKLISLLFILPLLFVAARGSVDTFPLTERQSSISSNSFINSLTQNAIFHLKYAYKHRKENNFNQSSSAILKKAKVPDKKTLLAKSGYNNANPLVQTTPTNKLLENKPPHVIFIQMEGWSTHIALSHSDKNPVLGSFKKHADQDYFFTRFLSNRYGTNPTIENLLLNSPITPISQSSGFKTSFSLSNVVPFKQSGYQTNFISGGYSSWRNHDVFWPKQGFDHYIDRSIIEEKYQVKADNPWGVYDEYLFDYLRDHLLQEKDKPSFNFVLTTNNHPPVRLPDDYQAPDFDLSTFNFKDDLEFKTTMLSAYHYQSDALGEFMDWLKDSPLKDKVIVVATGDHILKGFDDYNSLEKQFLRYAVATYLYIPDQYNLFKNRPKEQVNNLAGSHVDLLPTLFELSLSNAPYYAFGMPLMKKLDDDTYGWIDQGAFVTQQGLINVDTEKFYSWNKQSKSLLNKTAEELSDKQRGMIKQENYRLWLKEWLLYNDKQKQD